MISNKVIRILSLGAMIVIGVVGLVLVGLVLGASPDTTGLSDREIITAKVGAMSAYLGGLNTIYVGSLILALVVILGGWVAKLIGNPKSALGSLASIAALALIGFISWQLADEYVNWGDLKQEQITELNTTFSTGQRKFSGANVWAMFILLGLTGVALVGMELFRFIRSRR